MKIEADKEYTVDFFTVGYRHGEIRGLSCLHPGCTVSLCKSNYRRQGDRSGLGAYNRMRATMIRHWHTAHRAALQPGAVGPEHPVL